ncbi:MAG TPA: GAF domain-containing sensor histidine kinase [Candidatus Limnocylindria bacterium]
MTAAELLQAIAQVTWLAIGAVEIARAVRRPTRTTIDIALFFGAIALVTVEGRLVALAELPYEDLVRATTLVIVIALPYLLLRVTRDFTTVAMPIVRVVELGLVASVILIATFGTTVLAATLYVVVYFAAVAIYCAARAVTLAGSSYGVTRRRMGAVAAGSYFLGMAILIAGIALVAPGLAGVTAALTQICTVGSAISYAIGFTPPNELRKYWQLPELRAFLSRAAALPRATMDEIVDDLSEVAGRALGARSTIAVWDEAHRVLRFRDTVGAVPPEVGPSTFLSWRVFEGQRSLYVPDASAANPANAELYRSAGVGPVLIAPITAGERRLGVLEVFASREPIFEEDDLAFVELMAQQAAVIMEGRKLIDEAARARAVEEAARIKEDFVSAAAHDLKTPLTTIVAQAQLLERRAAREGRTAELTGIQRLVRETTQLSRLVEELLDASRLERGALPIQPEPGDLAAIAREVTARERAGADRIQIVSNGTVAGMYDPERIRQLIDNLVENALKYSPAEDPIEVRVWSEDSTARLSVTDHGIGIPPEDMPHVFERFRRGSNVDHRKFGGIGLGLYICHGIVEQHGGRVWVESAPGRGTVFHVTFPVSAARERPASDATMVAS